MDEPVGLDFVTNDRHQGFTCRIWNDLCVNPAATFEDSEHRYFTGRPASALAFTVAAKIAFVHFKLT